MFDKEQLKKELESVEKNDNLISLLEASKLSPYSQEYISLLARRGKMFAKKVGRNWFTTQEAVQEYIQKYRVVHPLKKESAQIQAEIKEPEAEFIPIASAYATLASNPIIEPAVADLYTPASHWKVLPNIFQAVGSVIGIILIILGISGVIQDLGSPDNPVLTKAKSLYERLANRQDKANQYAGDVVILDPTTGISIFGSIPTSSTQTVGETLPPREVQVVVRSVTNAEKFNNLAPQDFTLAFITKNGNVTYDNVQLQGDATVGKTLTVNGATQLRSSLAVQGKLGVIGQATFNQGLRITGGNVAVEKGTIEVASTKMVKNLNAELWQGLRPNDLIASTASGSYTVNNITNVTNTGGSGGTVNASLTLDDVVENGNETDNLAFFFGGLYGGNGSFSSLGVSGDAAIGSSERWYDSLFTVQSKKFRLNENGDLIVSGTSSFGGNASFSSNVTISGHASASQTFGSGLADCDVSTTSKLLWDSTTGKFSCGTDQSGGGGSALQIKEGLTSILNPTATISFEAGNFNISASGSNEVVVKLDWTNGPASRAANETITGKWLFSGASNQFSNTLEIGTASISALTVAGTAFRPVTSNSLDFDEIVNAATLDANFSVASTSNNYTWDFLDTQVSFAGGRIMPNGNVGIGTTSPGAKLNVVASASEGEVFQVRTNTPTTIIDDDFAILSLGNSNTTNNNYAGLSFNSKNSIGSYTGFGGITMIFKNHAAGATTSDLTFSTILNDSITEKLRITSDGLVGIGTMNVDTKFEVGGTASISGATTLKGVTYTWPSAQGGASTVLTNNGSGTLTWGTVSAGVASNGLDFDEFVDSMTLDANLTIASAGFTWDFGKTNLLGIGNASVSKNFEVRTGYASISNTLFIDTGTNGRVGIGTSAPGTALEIKSTTAQLSLTEPTNGDRTATIKTLSNGTMQIAPYFSTAATLDLLFSTTPFITFNRAADGKSYLYGSGTGALNINGNGSSIEVSGTTFTVNTNALHVTTGKNIGIGTTVPLTKLEVQGTASASNLLTVGSLQVANAGATVSYSRFGTAATGHSLSAANDLLISGNFEVDGSAFFDGIASVASNFEASGYASASAFVLPSTAGGTLADCDAAGDTLNWDATTRKFTCGTDGGVSSNSIDFDEIVNAATLDANFSIASTSNNYTWDFLDTQVSFAGGRILPNGRVGIGTTAPTVPLEVVGNTYINGLAGINIAPETGYALKTGAGVVSLAGILRVGGATLSIGGASEGNSPTFKFGSAATPTNPGTTTHNFYLNLVKGIPGNNTASYILGDSFIVTPGAGGYGASGTVNGGNAGTFDVMLTAGGAGIGGGTNGTDGSFRVFNSSSNQIFGVLNSGKVGIGTTAPTTKLEIQGTASASYLLTGNTLQVGGYSSAAYSRFGTGVTDSGNLTTSSDLLVSGKFETLGAGYFGSTLVSGDIITGAGFISTTPGNVSSPTYTFTGDLDTGMWKPAANTLAFSTGGAERLRIDSIGGVAIGARGAESSVLLEVGGEILASSAGEPTLKLHSTSVSNTDREFALKAGLIAGNTEALWIVNGQDDPLMIVASTGNVTIGGIAPTSRLTVDGRTEIQGTASASYLLTGNTLQVGGYSSAAYSRFGTNTTGYSSFLSSANDLLISGDLEVDGNTFFDNSASVSGALEITKTGQSYASDGTVAFRISAATGRALQIGYDNTLDAAFLQSAREAVGGRALLLNPSGYTSGTGFVGVNVLAPEEQFTVGGNIFASSSGNVDLILRSSTATGDDGKFVIRSTGASDRLEIMNGTTPTSLITISSTGFTGIGTTTPAMLLTVASTSTNHNIVRFQDSDGTCDGNPTTIGMSFSCSSDARLKDDITDAGPILNRLMDIRIRDYTVKASGDRATGIIAQEIRETWPELVSSSSSGFLLVSQPSTWQIIKALQEQQAQISEIASGSGGNIGATSVFGDAVDAIVKSIKVLGDSVVNGARKTYFALADAFPKGDIGLIADDWNVRGVDLGSNIPASLQTLFTGVGSQPAPQSKLELDETKTSLAAFGVDSTRAEIQVTGTGTLVNGEARVYFDKSFSAIISDLIPVRVLLTPLAEDIAGKLYVSEKSSFGFVVKSPGSLSNSQFDWLVVARRKGYDNGAQATTTPQPTDTVVPQASPSITPVDSVAPTPPPVVEPTTTPVESPSPSPITEPSGTPEPTIEPVASLTPTPTPILTPTPESTPAPTPEPPPPTPTPEPVSTPAPESAPTPPPTE